MVSEGVEQFGVGDPDDCAMRREGGRVSSGFEPVAAASLQRSWRMTCEQRREACAPSMPAARAACTPETPSSKTRTFFRSSGVLRALDSQSALHDRLTQPVRREGART